MVWRLKSNTSARTNRKDTEKKEMEREKEKKKTYKI